MQRQRTGVVGGHPADGVDGRDARDAESMVDARDGRLLTPAPRLQGPTGLIGNGGGEDGDGGGEGGGGVRA